MYKEDAKTKCYIELESRTPGKGNDMLRIHLNQRMFHGKNPRGFIQRGGDRKLEVDDYIRYYQRVWKLERAH